MPVDGFKVHGALCLAVVCSGVGAAIAGVGNTALTLAGPQVLSLIQQAPAALASYPALSLTGTFTASANGRNVSEQLSGVSTPDGRTGTLSIAASTGVRLRVNIIDGTTYVPVPPAGVAYFGNHHWLSCTPPEHAPAHATTPNDPFSFLSLMPGATGPVHIVGTATIDGARTTHYSVDVDLIRAAQQAQSADGTSITPAQIQAMEQAGLRIAPLDVWIDGQNAVRQFGLQLHASGITIKIRLRVHGSSTPPELTAPPASDTTDATPCSFMFQQLQSHQNG